MLFQYNLTPKIKGAMGNCLPFGEWDPRRTKATLCLDFSRASSDAAPGRRRGQLWAGTGPGPLRSRNKWQVDASAGIAVQHPVGVVVFCSWLHTKNDSCRGCLRRPVGHNLRGTSHSEHWVEIGHFRGRVSLLDGLHVPWQCAETQSQEGRPEFERSWNQFYFCSCMMFSMSFLPFRSNKFINRLEYHSWYPYFGGDI